MVELFCVLLVVLSQNVTFILILFWRFAGEEIEVLGGPDELNWGLGKKDGRVGLFPATYVQKI